MGRGWAIAMCALVGVGVTACEKKRDDVVSVKTDDAAMAAAMAEARQRWPEFVAAFAKKEPNVAYAVKVAMPLKNGDGAEHMWLQVVSITNGTVTGLLDNIPVNDVGAKQGDRVSVKETEIEDWIIGRGPENITGGFTSKVLKERKR